MHVLTAELPFGVYNVFSDSYSVFAAFERCMSFWNEAFTKESPGASQCMITIIMMRYQTMGSSCGLLNMVLDSTALET